MKKLLLVFALIYLASCSSLCYREDDDNPSKGTCFKREVSDEEKKAGLSCCYVKVKVTAMGETQTGAGCYPLSSKYSKSEVEKIIKEEMGEMADLVELEVKEFTCKGSFLKFGFLLLALLFI